MASCAICSMVSGVVPVEPPTPAFERHDPPLPRRERVDQGGVPVVEIAAEVLEQDQRHRAFAVGIAVGVADAVGVTDPAVWKLRISPGHGCSPRPLSGFRTSAAPANAC